MAVLVKALAMHALSIKQTGSTSNQPVSPTAYAGASYTGTSCAGRGTCLLLGVRCLVFALWSIAGCAAIAQDRPAGAVIEAPAISVAIARGHQVLRKGVANYPENRSCFSCHHQTLPLLALSLYQRADVRSVDDSFIKDATTVAIVDFTEKSFASKRDVMYEGGGVGGGALTVGYGLWAMDLADVPRNGTIDAMVEYLLKTQTPDGGWKFQSVRPPAASSRAMTTAIAVYGLRAYADSPSLQTKLRQSLLQALVYARQLESPADHEDLIGQMWLNQQLLASGLEIDPSDRSAETDAQAHKADHDRLAKLRSELVATQRDDGGWAQEKSQDKAQGSDAYATGQALLMLAQYRDLQAQEDQSKDIHHTAAFERGIDYLLQSQHADGSWHVVTRAKPVQVYFDNGDPHGKDQFISMMATCWAIAALSNYHASGVDPLESLQWAKRQ